MILLAGLMKNVKCPIIIRYVDVKLDTRETHVRQNVCQVIYERDIIISDSLIEFLIRMYSLGPILIYLDLFGTFSLTFYLYLSICRYSYISLPGKLSFQEM